MSVRKWLAWKLRQLSARLYDGEWVEEIAIRTPSGRELSIEVLGDEYGCGISCTGGIRWAAGSPMTADVEGWTFTWPEPRRWEDAL